MKIAKTLAAAALCRKNSGSSGIVPVGMLVGICGTGCKNI